MTRIVVSNTEASYGLAGREGQARMQGRRQLGMPASMLMRVRVCIRVRVRISWACWPPGS